MKKILALVVALALVFTCFSGCFTTAADAATSPAPSISVVDVTVEAEDTEAKVVVEGENFDDLAASNLVIDFDDNLSVDVPETWATVGNAGEVVYTVDEATNTYKIISWVATSDAGVASFEFSFDVTFAANDTELDVVYTVDLVSVDAGTYGETAINNIALIDGTVTQKAIVVEEPEAVSSLELYLGGELSETIGYDSLATALTDAAEYANTKVGNNYYDPILVLNENVTLTENIEVGAYTTFNLGDYVVTTGDYDFNITSSGVVKANYQIADFASNVFYNEAVANNVYTYTAKLQLTVSSVSLILSNTIFAQYSATIESNTYSGDVEYGIAYTKGNSDTIYNISETSDDSTIVLSNSKVTADTYGIRSYEMNDNIVLHFYAKTIIDGQDYYVYSNSVTYSVVEYAKAILAKGEEIPSNLMKAMLNYGAAAQTRFGINADSLANSILDEADKIIPTDLGDDVLVPALAKPEMNYYSDGYVAFGALELEEAINIWFTPDALNNSYEYELLVWNAAEYNALAVEGANLEEVLVADNCNTILTLNENGVFVLEGISAKKFADTYFVRLVEKTPEGAKYDSVISYSATQYAIESIQKGSIDSELCRAIALYSAAARPYFDNYVINSCVD